MTVMPSGYDVADKAVSTDDNINEMICLDEMFSALVESKVESMKRASLNSLKDKKYCSNLLKNQKCTRLTSTSTTGSSSHHQLHHDYLKKNYSDERKNYRHRRRHDSAPCEKFIDELHGHQKRHGGSKARRRASELPRSSPRKRHRNSRHLHMQQQDDVHMGLDSQIELFGLDGDISLINFDRARETTNATIEYPRLHQSAYSPSAAHLKYIYDDDDFVTLNLEDEFELDSLQSSWNDQERDTNLKHENNNYHRSRRKRKKKRKRRRRVEDLIMEDVPEVLLVNQDDLSARARWTIVVTACVLFAMSLLLVGVTLRMAPIIDEMVRKENEELINSLNRDPPVPVNNT